MTATRRVRALTTVLDLRAFMRQSHVSESHARTGTTLAVIQGR